jgi:alkanesulfonate monooxygenase SsuD/methylene tetrahydromethanopterin reductase-like flavin-dependent oxidoreductase (luciferase family)
MGIDVKVPPEAHDLATLQKFWRDAEEAGFDRVWTSDHLHATADPLLPAFEAWTTLTALGMTTSRVRIGCGMTAVTFRNPGLLAKMAVTVDHLTHGRLEMGLGAGWYERDHVGFGFPFPEAKDRVAMLDEACEIMRRLWTEEVVDHDGRFWQLRGARSVPRPVQTTIPMTIGGRGRGMLRVVAKHADEWNWLGDSLEDYIRLSAMVDEFAVDAGRLPAAIARTAQFLLRSDAPADFEPLVAELPAYQQAGAQNFVFAFRRAPSRATLDNLLSATRTVLAG